MRVTLWVDALSRQLSGIGRYAWELSRGLARRDAFESLQFLARGRMIDDPAILLDLDHLPRIPRWRRPASRWVTRQALRRNLVHGPNYFLPAGADTGVITVHDLSVFRFPGTHPAERVRAFETEFMHSLDRATHVITDTETIRGELIDAFSLDPKRVTAVPLGVDARYRPGKKKEVEEGIRHLGLTPGEYGLCVSTLEPRKRISELVAAWRLLPPDLRSRYPLVLAGGSGWANDGMREEIEEASREGWLRYLGFVDEQALPALYSGAVIFAYPSAYEGFGLPPLEAMASGTPVLVADRSCLPEVCGDAARYLDPDDIEGIAATVAGSLTDVSWRSAARERGLARARAFTWDRCIDGTISVYQRAWQSR